jgi:hypothetical protein
MQRAVNTTIVEEIFSMWFAYIHCGATDVFPMDPPKDYVSGMNRIKSKLRESVGEREWSESSAVKEEVFG